MSEIPGTDEKRLAIENAVSSAFAKCQNRFLGLREMKNLLATVLPDHVQVRYWYGELREFKKNNSMKDILLSQEFPKYELMIDELMIGINEKINESDDLTRIMAMNWEQQLYHHYDDWNEKIYIKPFLEHMGILTQVSGVMGKGKSDYALTLGQYLLKKGFTIITNIPCKHAILVRRGEIIPPKKIYHKNFYQTVRMSDLLWFSIQCIREDRSIVILWDEVSQFYARQQAATRSNIDTSKFLRLIRKFNLSIIFIEQLEGGLSTIATTMLAATYHKTRLKKLHYTSRFLERNYNHYMESVPRTEIKFETMGIGQFSMDVDFAAMFESIDIDDGATIDAIESYLVNLTKG